MHIGERRTCPRYDLRLRCRIRANFGGDFEGMTENLSRHGALVLIRRRDFTGRFLRRDDFVRITVDLPCQGTRAPRYLECGAVLIRMAEDHSGFIPLGFQVDQMRFRGQTGADHDAALADLACSGYLP